ncbi:MAG: hypothetical protein LQ350_007760 [Teloschistes chrysophthalmus]|nr:MAG: hypothetical protein LQ350_007760 [Niorma chrysophthalma]
MKDAEIPGGQGNYVSSTGALGFTQARSGLIPDGAALQTFNTTVGPENGPLGQFTFEGLGTTGFLACPVTKTKGPYQVFADVERLKHGDVPSKSPFSQEATAWQYT